MILLDTYLRSVSIREAMENPDLEVADVFKTDPLPAPLPELSEGYFWRDGDVGYLVSGHTESIDISFPNWTALENNRLWQYNFTAMSTQSGLSWSYRDIPEVKRGFQQGCFRALDTPRVLAWRNEF